MLGKVYIFSLFECFLYLPISFVLLNVIGWELFVIISLFFVWIYPFDMKSSWGDNITFLGDEDSWTIVFLECPFVIYCCVWSALFKSHKLFIGVYLSNTFLGEVPFYFFGDILLKLFYLLLCSFSLITSFLYNLSFYLFKFSHLFNL